jgi:hypothetical protein
MTGSYVGSAKTSQTGSVNALTGATVPAGIARDLVLVGWVSDSSQTATLDAAYTSESAGADGACRLVVGSRRTPGNGGGVDVSLSSGATANRQAAVVGRYRGFVVNHANIVASDEPGSDTTHAAGTITTTHTDSGLVAFYSERATSNALPITPPAGAGYTARQSFATGGNGGVGVALADKLTGNPKGTPVSPGDWLGTTVASAARIVTVELMPLIDTTMDALLPGLTGAITGDTVDAGAIAGQLPGLVGAFTGKEVDRATAAGQLPRLVGSFVGIEVDAGAVAGQLPRLIAVFTGSIEDDAAFTGMLPGLLAALYATVGAAPDTRDIEISTALELDRWDTIVEPDRFGSYLELDRYTTEVEA